MQCRNHESAPAVDRCAGCAESFCEYCLVEVVGQKYCASCKVMAVKAPTVPIGEGNQSSEAAGKALMYSIIGIFCFGIVFGPMAVSKAVEARREIRDDPSLCGLAKANVGLLLGIAVSILWVLGMISRFSN